MNLLNIDIRGTNNYKGMATIGTDITAGLTTSLKALGDGVGGYSPLQLSETQVELGTLVSMDFGNASANNRYLFKADLVGGSSAWQLYSVNAGTGNGINYFGALNFVGIGGGFVPSARLHVRGDGTNPYARFEDNAGANSITLGLSSGLPTISWAAGSYIQSSGSVSNIYMASSTIYYTTWSNSTDFSYALIPVNSVNATSGTRGIYSQSGTFAAAAGSANFIPLSITYTINNSGAQSGTATGIFLNATETALNSMTHNLMDLGTGGGTYVSRFKVGRVYDAAFSFNATSTALNWRPLFNMSKVGGTGTPALSFGVGSGGTGSSAYIASSNDDMYLGTDTSSAFTTNIVLKANGVGFVGWGGLTSAYPALVRNGADLEVRPGDGVGFASLWCNISYVSRLYQTGGNFDLRGSGGNVFGSTTPNTSAILQADSTTKGFLPPRMTTSERDAISTPATGLEIFNTTTNKKNFYNGSAWEVVTSA